MSELSHSILSLINGLSVGDIVELSLKITVLLAMALSVRVVRKNTSSSLQYLIYSIALLSILLLPLISLLLPSWHMPRMQTVLPKQLYVISLQMETIDNLPNGLTAIAGENQGRTQWNYFKIAYSIWCIGLLFVVIKLFFGVIWG